MNFRSEKQYYLCETSLKLLTKATVGAFMQQGKQTAHERGTSFMMDRIFAGTSIELEKLKTNCWSCLQTI